MPECNRFNPDRSIHRAQVTQLEVWWMWHCWTFLQVIFDVTLLTFGFWINCFYKTRYWLNIFRDSETINNFMTRALFRHCAINNKPGRSYRNNSHTLRDLYETRYTLSTSITVQWSKISTKTVIKGCDLQKTFFNFIINNFLFTNLTFSSQDTPKHCNNVSYKVIYDLKMEH
jgi:hypothetical protein